jgi:hypothetical protein
MGRKIKNIRSLKGVNQNPFKKELLEDFQVIKKREYIDQEGRRGVTNTIVNREDEVVGESRFFRYKKYDSEQFAKVFVSRISAMWDMSKTASRVFSYILSILPKDKDTIYMDVSSAKEFTTYKNDASIWNGMKWLMENDFIAKSDRTNIYFINPTIFFNGDRVAFVDILIKDHKKKILNQENPSRCDQKKYLSASSGLV